MIHNKDILLEFFEDEVSEVRIVIEKVKEISLEHRLTPETRTVLDLINHIAQIPRIDISIYSGDFTTGEQTHKMELELNRTSIVDVLQVFEAGSNYLLDFFKTMSDKVFFKENLKPFYEPNSKPRSWTHFLPKLIAHIALHKGILWSYLKTANANVTMFTYYGAKD